jgi:hypothetical protein
MWPPRGPLHSVPFTPSHSTATSILLLPVVPRIFTFLLPLITQPDPRGHLLLFKVIRCQREVELEYFGEKQKQKENALCITRVRVTLLYPSSGSLLHDNRTRPRRITTTVIVTIGETTTLGMCRAWEYFGRGYGQDAGEKRQTEERGGERARAASGEAECALARREHRMSLLCPSRLETSKFVELVRQRISVVNYLAYHTTSIILPFSKWLYWPPGGAVMVGG